MRIDRDEWPDVPRLAMPLQMWSWDFSMASADGVIATDGGGLDPNTLVDDAQGGAVVVDDAQAGAVVLVDGPHVP